MEELDFIVLESIHTATQGGGSFYVDPALGATFEAKGYIKLFPEIKDEATGWIAAQTTPLGNQMVPVKRQELNNAAEALAPVTEEAAEASALPPTPPLAEIPVAPVVPVQAEPAPTVAPVYEKESLAAAAAVAVAVAVAVDDIKPVPSDFAIHKGGTVPEKANRLARKAIYPFAQLELNDFFFVPATEAKPNPAKALASTVSSASRRYAKLIGTKKMKRKGEVKDVAAYEYERKFAVATVNQGDKQGDFVVPANGAIVIRIPIE